MKIRGVVAGFIGTITISILMLIKVKLNFMINLDVIHMLTLKTGGSPTIGLFSHFIIGTVGYGIYFSFIIPFISDKKIIIQGIILGFIAWLTMMLAMPILGHSFFIMDMGFMAQILTLLFHLIFGMVIIIVYIKLED